jgi:hypothetical protein
MYLASNIEHERGTLFYQFTPVFSFQSMVNLRSETADFGSGQGRSEWKPQAVPRTAEDSPGARTKAWAERCSFWMNTSAAIQPHRISRSRIGLDLLQLTVVDARQHLLMVL